MVSLSMYPAEPVDINASAPSTRAQSSQGGSAHSDVGSLGIGMVEDSDAMPDVEVVGGEGGHDEVGVDTCSARSVSAIRGDFVWLDKSQKR